MKLFLLGLLLGLTLGSTITYGFCSVYLNRPRIRVEVIQHPSCFVLPGGQ